MKVKRLFAALLTGLSVQAGAHSMERGPLPAEILENQNDLDYLSRCAGFKTPKGALGLHYFYGLAPEAQRMITKLLMADNVTTQRAALGVIHHDGAPSKELRELYWKRVPALARSPDRTVRLRAAESIGRAHISEGTEELIALLEDPDAEIRGAAIHSLHRLKVERAKPLLRELKTKEKSRRNRSLINSFLKNEPTEPKY